MIYLSHMSALTIYLDGPTETRLRQAAKRTGEPVSRFIARLVVERTADGWPDDIMALAGSWSDADDRPVQVGADSPRVAW